MSTRSKEGLVRQDRRAARRFPVQFELTYRTVSTRSAAMTGTGKTVNVSSSGVLFATETVPSIGRRIELAVSWPVALDEKIPLTLVARGPVVRVGPGMAAMEIEHYNFRTAPRGSSRRPPGRSPTP